MRCRTKARRLRSKVHPKPSSGRRGWFVAGTMRRFIFPSPSTHTSTPRDQPQVELSSHELLCCQNHCGRLRAFGVPALILYELPLRSSSLNSSILSSRKINHSRRWNNYRVRSTKRATHGSNALLLSKSFRTHSRPIPSGLRGSSARPRRSPYLIIPTLRTSTA